MPDEPVQIQFRPPGQGGFMPVATGTTGSDGQFSVATTLPSGGYVRAAFAGDTGLEPSYSDPGWGIHLGATHLPSRLVLDPVPGSVSAGTPVTFSGTMQVEVNGTWQPFEGTPLTLTMEPYTSSQPNVTYATTSGPDGQFSLTEPVSETSEWSVNTSLDGSYWPDWFPDYTRSDYNWIYAPVVTTTSLPVANQADPGGADRDDAYKTQLQSDVSLLDAPFTWRITSGALPKGLSLSSAGTISGTDLTAAPGAYDFTVTATNAFGSTGSKSLSITVRKPSELAAAYACGAWNNRHWKIANVAGGRGRTAHYYTYFPKLGYYKWQGKVWVPAGATVKIVTRHGSGNLRVNYANGYSVTEHAYASPSPYKSCPA